MVELPSVVHKRWGWRDWAGDVVITLTTFGIAALTALRFYEQRGLDYYVGGLTVLAVVVMLVSAQRARRTSRREAKVRSLKEPADLAGVARSIHSQIEGLCATHDLEAGDLRVTLHKVHLDPKTGEPDRLEQVIAYVGGRRGGAGRLTPARAGIVGMAARAEDMFFSGRAADDPIENYVGKLVEDWGMTWSEAQRTSGDRRAWIACPVIGARGDKPFAVVYADSPTPDLFEHAGLQEAVIQGAETIAHIAVAAYSV